MPERSRQWHEDLKQSVLNDDEYRAEYNAFKLQIELADQLKKSRKKADMTQDEVALKMTTTKSTVARIEASGGRGKHSPSLKTLSKYADAVGCDLNITLKKRKHG